jgi:hypothetical protein
MQARTQALRPVRPEEFGIEENYKYGKAKLTSGPRHVSNVLYLWRKKNKNKK